MVERAEISQCIVIVLLCQGFSESIVMGCLPTAPVMLAVVTCVSCLSGFCGSVYPQ
jgi:hypothetical protein